IPVKGGMINLAAKLVLNQNGQPFFVYHKYDSLGNLQFYIALTENGEWRHHSITDWDYRWNFHGIGSMDSEVFIKYFESLDGGFYGVGYTHSKNGEGTLILNSNFKHIHTKVEPFFVDSAFQKEGDFPGLNIKK